MLTIIFVVAMAWIAWKMLVWGIKAAWGITKIICTVMLFPIVLFVLVCAGLIYVAIPILAFVGLFILISRIATD
jgi:hypothetical protein